jgi:hypothetical protein
MPDWLQTAVSNGDPLPPAAVLWSRVLLAVVCGFVVAAVYMATLGRRQADARTLPTTLVLLCVLIAVVTLVIGNSVARAFGLVGALSIVRFRTVVEDTRDTAFVIFAVAVGMAVGAGYAVLALVAVPAVTVAAAIMGWVDGPRRAGGVPVTLTVRLALGLVPAAVVGEVFDKHLTLVRLTAAETAKQGSSVDFKYAARLTDPAAAVGLVTDLNRVEGVQAVDLRITGNGL